MKNLLPSMDELKKFGLMASGGIAEEMGAKIVKENVNVDFIAKYPIIVDALFLVAGVFMSKNKQLREIGMGIGVSATSNLILEAYEMMTAKPAPVKK